MTSLDRDLKSNLRASMISIRRQLRLVDLTKLGLQRMNIRPSQMFETNKPDYPQDPRVGALVAPGIARGTGPHVDVGAQPGVDGHHAVRRPC